MIERIKHLGATGLYAKMFANAEEAKLLVNEAKRVIAESSGK